ncbi:metallophosphoesterase [Candidatus Woesearchaeota archaeon]|nr:metallophosphoesterase [Candidatus Woesearchaeota archaeon]MBW3021296.1 metallophosphoesterase [Candidatus Woesearchaeota archaeon]
MSNEVIKKKQIVDFFLKRNILVSNDFLNTIDTSKEVGEVDELLKNNVSEDILILNPDLAELNMNKDINWKEFEKSKAFLEKGKGTAYNKFLDYINKEELQHHTEEIEDTSVKIVSSYCKPSKKRTVQDFVKYFNLRCKSLEKMLKNRRELQNVSSINRILAKKDKENTSLIGLINEKAVSKNNNIILTVEDSTGSIKVVINKNKPEMFDIAKDIVLDEVIGVAGVNNGNVVFANKIFLPDVPVHKELKKSPDECYAMFVSDFHFGNSLFLHKEFDRLIKWINGELGNAEQRTVASKLKYLFVVGDLVEGVGIYPGQEDDLEIKDIYMQYEVLAKILKKIPTNIKIIVCPGNHDAMRIAEPQPVLYKDFAKSIWQLPNVILVSNPAVVNIHSSDDFSGFDVLMYHGFSFPYLSDNIISIRQAGGMTRADLIMKFLMQRRHLAPPHNSNLSIPDVDEDPLLIKSVPDFFVTGHIHRTSVATYRNVTLLNCSCWVSQSPEQAKRGIIPEPARALIVNLQTRQVKIMKFEGK